MANTETKEPLLWTYVGRRFVKGSTVKQCFIELDDPESIRWFNKVKSSRFQGCIIGTEYAIKDKFPDYWSDIATGKKANESERIRWQARDRATEMEKRQKSVKCSPDLDKLVENLKSRRLQLSPTQRVGFDAWLLNAIR